MIYPIVILVEPENEYNIGFIARAMKNFGLKELRLVNPKVSLSEGAEKCAAHAKDILFNCKIFNSLLDSIQDIDFKIATTANVATDPSNLLRIAIPVYELGKKLSLIENKIAIIFGRESIGLKNEELEFCDILINIPTDPCYRTMNVSHAASIIFYELYKTHRKFDKKLIGASIELRKRLIEYFLQLAYESEIPGHKIKQAYRAFKNVINRASISQREASLLIGILRKAVNLIKKHDQVIC
ncbi:MAG: RNA methyltransferase [Candidatus Bathyarchaeia archaeon]